MTIGRKRLARELNITESKARTALEKIRFGMPSEVTSEVTNEFTTFRILNWALYQRKVTNEVTNKSPTNHHTIKNKNKEEEGREIESEKSFATFWSAYPKKLAKADAKKAWTKIKNPPLDLILKAIEDQKKTDQWQKDDGQFIPYPATWLNDRRWEDEIPPPKASNYGAEIAEILKRGRKHRRTDAGN